MSDDSKMRITSLNSHSAGICFGTRCWDKSRRVCREKESPSTLCRQNRGASEVPTDHHRKPLWSTGGSLWGFRAKKPVLHTQQYRKCYSNLSIRKTTIFTIKLYSYPMGLLVVTVETSDRKEASMALPGEKGDHFNLNWGGSKEGGLSVDYIP